jgi:peptide/nickel transport system substrate-binding protein
VSRARRAVQGIILLPVVGMSLWFGAACGQATRRSDPGIVTVAVATSPVNLDPRVGNDDGSQKVHQLLYSFLLTKDRHLQVIPEVATRWEMPDDRTYVLHLRDDVWFHDGRQLTAADVAYTFTSLLDEAFVSPKKAAFRMVETVQALDRYTVMFRLKEPFGSFPINLVMAIVPEGSGRELAEHPVGSGPFRLVHFAADDQIVLEPFERHFAGPPRNRGVILKIVPDDTMRGLELRKGTVDLVVNDLSPDIVHQLEQSGKLHVERSPGTDYTYIGVNLRHPILSDRRVRHAIGHAIDRRAIVQYLRRGLATPAVGILPPVSPFFEPAVFSPDHDPAKARQLLDEAGFPDPDGDGPAMRFRLSLKTSTNEYYRLQAAVLQQDLRNVGVALDVRSYEFATLYNDVLRGNFELFTLQWVGVSDPDILRRVFHSQQVPPAGYNRGFYVNPDVDALIDRATVSTSDEERTRLYRRAQQLIAFDAPYISLWYKTNIAVASDDVRGITLLPAADFTFLKGVYREPPAAPTADSLSP